MVLRQKLASENILSTANSETAKKALANRHGRTALTFKVTGKRVKCQEGPLYGPTVALTPALLSTDEPVGLEHFNGPMDPNSKVLFVLESRKVTASSGFPMGNHILESGKAANSMETEFLATQKGKKGKENGRTDSWSGGPGRSSCD
jgi:hypothetical protein